MISSLFRLSWWRQALRHYQMTLLPTEGPEAQLLRALSLLGLPFYVVAALAMLNGYGSPSALIFMLCGVVLSLLCAYLSGTPRYRLGILLLVSMTLALVFLVILTGVYAVYNVAVLTIPILIASLFYRPWMVISLAAASLVLSQFIITFRGVEHTGPLLGVQLFVGSIAVGVALITDIARQSNIRLRQSQQRYQSAFEHIPVSLWEEDFSPILHQLEVLRRSGVSDLEAHLRANPAVLDNLVSRLQVLDVNQATLKMHQMTEKADLLKRVDGMIRPENREFFIQEMLAIDARQLTFERESSHLSILGEPRDFNIAWQVMTGHEQDFSRVLVSISDLTERRRAEAQRLDLAVERERVALLQRFLGDVSHDLMTPITVLKSGLYLLNKDTRNGEIERALRRVPMLEGELQRLEDLIQDMLTLSRLDQPENRQFDLQAQDVNQVVSELTHKFESVAADRQQVLTLRTGPEMLVARINRANLERALGNLVANAIKYTPPGGSITISTERVENQVLISVQDTGNGISPEDLPHIFERFYRAEAHRPTSSGSGLGLAIAERIVNAHGGRVDVQSQIGIGSVFRVHLPLVTELPQVTAAVEGRE